MDDLLAPQDHCTPLIWLLLSVWRAVRRAAYRVVGDVLASQAQLVPRIWLLLSVFVGLVARVFITLKGPVPERIRQMTYSDDVVGARGVYVGIYVLTTVLGLHSSIEPATHDRAAELTRVLSSMRFVTSFAFGCAGTVRILHMDVLDFSVQRIGVIMAAYSVLIAVVEVPSGAISDVWGRRKTKLLASWVMAGSYLLLATASGLGDIVVSAALLGVGRALFSGAADSWFVDEIGDAKDPRVLVGLSRSEAAHNLGFGIGSLTGALLPQLYADSVDDRLVFAPVFVLGAIMLFVDILLTIRRMTEHRPPAAYPVGGVWSTTLAGVRNALDSRLPRWASFAMMAIGGAIACTELLTPLGLAKGVGTERALIVFGPLVAGAWIFSAVASYFTDRLEKSIGSMQRASGVLLVAIGALVLPVGLGTWFGAVASYVGINFVLGALLPLLSTTLHQHVRSSNRSAASSTLNLSLMAGAAGGSFMVGGLGGQAVLVVAPVALIAAAALLLLPTQPDKELVSS